MFQETGDYVEKNLKTQSAQWRLESYSVRYIRAEGGDAEKYIHVRNKVTQGELETTIIGEMI